MQIKLGLVTCAALLILSGIAALFFLGSILAWTFLGTAWDQWYNLLRFAIWSALFVSCFYLLRMLWRIDLRTRAKSAKKGVSE